STRSHRCRARDARVSPMPRRLRRPRHPERAYHRTPHSRVRPRPKTESWVGLVNALQLLLAFLPLAVAADWLGWGGSAVFGFAALAIIPLAGLMGRATETLAARLGAGVGGLLNATFGNAAELIIALMALRKGLHDVVKASLTGSIIGNVLLVLGLAIL